jgi:hypothetical protein
MLKIYAFAMPCKNGDREFTKRKANVELNDTRMCAIWQTCDACELLSTNDQIKTISLNSNGVYINSNAILNLVK